MAKQLNVNLAFTADTAKAKQELATLQKQLRALTQNSAQNSPLGLTKEINSAINDVTKLEVALKKATSNTGTLDLGQFRQEMNKAGLTAEKIATQLSALGPGGTKAFAQLTRSITTAEIPLKRTSTLLTDFAITLKNTARWQISSSVLHGFMGSMQSAVYYAHDLNESLNNIRIVTGNNVDEMAKFAKEANKAAQALSTTTTEYTNASLIYYQQGLSDAEVKERTDVTVKMANVTRESAETVSQQMTAVWNNFDDGSKSLEYYADVMTALGAATASSTDEISEGLEKFAAVADTVGLSYEYATSALATVTATTRESADVVGNAFKTLFARIEGLQLGETLDDGTTVNKYSEALAKVGINIKDVSGEMKNMDQILDELGGKWQNLSKDQQLALAQTVAGVRQYTQLIALMDNWDFFQENLGIARSSKGALQEQADTYAESWEAARDRVTAAVEEIYNQLLNDKFFISLNDAFAKILNSISDTIDALGGLKGIIPLIGTLLLRAFGPELSNSINNAVHNLSLLTEAGKEAVIKTRMEMVEALRGITDDFGYSGPAQTEAFNIQADLQEQLIRKSVEIESINGKISEREQEQIQHLIDINNELGKAYVNSAKEREQQEETASILKQRMSQKVSVSGNLSDFNETSLYSRELQQQYTVGTRIVKQYYQTISQAAKQGAEEQKQAFQTIKQSLIELQENLDKTGVDYTEFREQFNTVINSTSLTELLANFEILEDHLIEIGGIAQLGFEELEQILVNAGMDSTQAATAIRQLQDAETNAGNAALREAQDLGVLRTQANSTSTAITGLKNETMSLGQSLVSISMTLSTFAMTLTTITGIIDTLENEDMSSSEKFLAIFTSLAMILPQILYTVQNVGPAIVGLASSLELVEAAGAGVLTSLGAIVAAAAPWVAGITAIVAVIYGLERAYTADVRAAEKVAKQADSLTEEYEQIQSAYDSLKETLENYQSAREALDSLTEGTVQWKDAVFDLNNQVLSLLGNYPQLADEIRTDNGVLSITEAGRKLLLEEEEKRVQQAYRNSLYAQYKGNEAKDFLSNKDFVKTFREKLDADISNRALFGENTYYSGINEKNLDKIFTALDKYGNSILKNSESLSEAADISIGVAETWLSLSDSSEKISAQYVSQNSVNKNNQIIAEELGKALIKEVGKENSTYSNLIAKAVTNKALEISENYEEEFKKMSDASVIQQYAEDIMGYTPSYSHTAYGRSNKIYRDINGNEIEIDAEVARKELMYNKISEEALSNVEEVEDALYKFYNNVLFANENTAGIIYGFSDNIEFLTEEEINELKTFVNSEDYNKIKDTFETFGITHDELQTNLQNIVENWEKEERKISESLSGEALFIYEGLNAYDLSLKGQRNIANTLKRSTALGADNITRWIQDIFAQENVDKQKFADILGSIDWDTVSVNDFKNKLLEAGIAIEGTNEDIQTFINTMSTSGASFEDLISKYAAIHKIIDKLNTGDTISAENYAILREGYSKFFTLMLDGTYKLTTDAKEFYKTVQNDQISQFEQDINKIKNQNAKYEEIKDYDLDNLLGRTVTIEEPESSGMGFNRSKLVIESSDSIEKELQVVKALYSDDEKILEKVYDLETKFKENSILESNDIEELNKLIIDVAENFKNLDSTIEENKNTIFQYELAIASTFDNLKDLRKALDEGTISVEAFNAAAVNLDNIKDIETLDSDELAEFAEYLQDIANTSKDISDNLSDDAAKVVAKGIMKMNDAVDTLATSFVSAEKNANAWSDIIMNSSRESEEYTEALTGTTKALASLLDISEEFISEDFVREHLEDIALAAKGNEDAIDRLKSELTEPIIAKIALDNNVEVGKIESELDKIQSWLNDKNLEVGAEIQDESFLQACNELISNSKMTADQVNALFDSIGFEAEFEKETSIVKQRVPKYTTKTSIEGVGFTDDGKPMVTTSTSSYQDGFDEFDGEMEIPALAMNGKTPKITKITKKATGSYNNYSSTNKGGKSPGKSSGGSSSDPDKKKHTEDKADRYYDINNAISAVNESLEKNAQLTKKLNSYQDHYAGKTLIANLRKQNDLLKERNLILGTQYKNYEELYKIQLQELEDLKVNIGGVWDGDVLTNYYELFQANLDRYNKAIDEYNAMSKDQQDKTGKAALEDAKTLYDKYKEYLERYQDLYYNKMYETENNLADIRQQKLENQLKLIENNLKSWEVNIELELDMTKLQREWNEFIKGVEEDFRKIYKDLIIEIESNTDNFSTYLDDAYTRIKQISDVEAEIRKMNASKDSNGVVQLTDDMMFGSISEAQEYLKNLQSELVSTGNELNNLYEQVWDNYIEGLDQAADNFEDIANELEHLSNNLEYQKQLIELMYGDEAYDLMNKYYTTQQKNLETQISSTRTQALFWEEQFNEAYRMNREQHDIDLNDMSTWTEDMKKAYDQMIKSQEKLNDLVIEGIENLRDDYINSIAKTLAEMDKTIWGMKFDELKEDWDFIQKRADEYLDDVEGAYAIQTLANKIDQGIAGTTDLKYQQKLAKLREDEITMLREKERLTQDDIDLAEARYNIALKEMALEEAQNSKTEMKLVRDTSGNWTYQYVADEEDVLNKQQELLDAYNNLYKIADEAYEHAMELAMDTYEEYKEKVKEIAEDITLTEEEKMVKIKELQDQYLPEIQAAMENAKIYEQETIMAAAATFAEVCEQDADAYTTLTDLQKELVDEVKEQHLEDYEEIREAILNNYDEISMKAKESFQEMNENSKTAAADVIRQWDKNTNDSVKGAMNEAFISLQRYTKDFENELYNLEAISGKTIMNQGGVVSDIDAIGTAIDTVSNKTEDMAHKAADNLDTLRGFVEEVERAWDKVINKIIEAINTVQEYLNYMEAAASASNTPLNFERPTGKPDTYESTLTSSSNGSDNDTNNIKNQSPINNNKELAVLDGYSIYYDPNGARNTIGIAKDGQLQAVFGYSSESDKTKKVHQWFTERGYTAYGASYATGGYTGEWGTNGRLAVLHQKELVLNQDDTLNMLSAVKAIRDIAGLNESISQTIASSIGQLIMRTVAAGGGNFNSGTNNNTSNVFNITAEFPNADDVQTIRDAILSLPNLASQFVNER